jgi:ring-1,2-phenylacetyl-CoA epoxidase subunit PaaD
MVTATTAYQAAAATPDPELPMVTVADLGILRAVELAGGQVTVTVAPTYSGCPAMAEISAGICGRLRRAGFDRVTVRIQLAPPWSSDWITADGRRKLAAAGIAPPAAPRQRGPVPLTLAFGPPDSPSCPRCGGARTRRTAQFGATACTSLHRCDECGEPFEVVKPL